MRLYPLYENKFGKFLKDLLRISYNLKHREFVKLPDTIFLDWINNYIFENGNDVRTIWMLISHVTKSRPKVFDDVYSKLWPQDKQEQFEIVNLLSENNLLDNHFMKDKLKESISNASGFECHNVIVKEENQEIIEELLKEPDFNTQRNVLASSFIELLAYFNDKQKHLFSILCKVDDLIKEQDLSFLSRHSIDEISLGITPTYRANISRIRTLTVEAGNTFRIVFAKFKIDYLENLIKFFNLPNKNNLSIFLVSLKQAHSKTFDLMKQHLSSQNWFDSIAHSPDLLRSMTIETHLKSLG